MGNSTEKFCKYLCCCIVISGITTGLYALINESLPSCWALCSSVFIIFMTIFAVYYKLKYKLEDEAESSSINTKYLKVLKAQRCRMRWKRAGLYVVMTLLFLIIICIVLISNICCDEEHPLVLSMTQMSLTPLHGHVFDYLVIEDSIPMLIVFTIACILLFFTLFFVYKISHKIQYINSSIIRIETYTATDISKDDERRIQLEIKRLTEELNADSLRDIWDAISKCH